MEILTSKEKGILTIELNRPKKKNAITSAMYQMFADALREAQNDSAVRVVLICGKPDIFTAGNDLEDFLKHSSGADMSNLSAAQFMDAFVRIQKPVIAAVSGPAIGIGVTMLLQCDVIYAAENARFSMPFAQLAVCPEFASSMLLPQMIGYHRAAEKLLFGEPFSAGEACDIGLVAKVLPLGELIPFARSQAAKLAAMPASSLRTTKSLLKSSQTEAVMTRIMEEGKQFGEMLSSPEAKEAFTAFFERRKPDFTKFS